MACRTLKYSKLKDLKDVDFNITYFKKYDMEKVRNQSFDYQLKEKENVVKEVTERIKEYSESVRLEKEIAVLSQKQTSAKRKQSNLLKTLKSLKKDKENKLSKDVQKKVSLYESHLALKIDSTSNTTKDGTSVSFSFYNIDEKNPEETCTLVLTISDSDIYKATDCNPPIAEMDQLILCLNKTDDLHQFVVDLRKKFCEYVTIKKFS